jgi:hypothetical protein
LLGYDTRFFFLELVLNIGCLDSGSLLLIYVLRFPNSSSGDDDVMLSVILADMNLFLSDSVLLEVDNDMLTLYVIVCRLFK